MNFKSDFLGIMTIRCRCRWGLGLAIGGWSLISSAALAQSVPDVEECNQFADSVNRNQTIMEQFEAEIETFATTATAAETLPEITTAAAQYVEALDVVTDSLDTLSRELATLTFEDSQIVEYRDDYVTVVGGFNTALAIVSEAMAEVATAETEEQLATSLADVAGDTATAVDQIEVLAVEESALIDNVNDYCAAAEQDWEKVQVQGVREVTGERTATTAAWADPSSSPMLL